MVILGLLMPLLAAGGWLWLIYVNDRFEKEPWGLVLKTAGLAAAVGLASLLVTAALSPWFGDGAVLNALFAVPLHLTAVVTALLALPYRNPNWNEPFDGLVYGGAAGVGYGLIYTLPSLLVSTDLGFRIAVFSIPIFVLAGVVLGHYASRARFSPRRGAWRHWLQGLGIAGLFLFGIDLALREGGEVVAGEHMLAGLMAYASNTLAWIIATRAMDLSEGASPFNPDLRLRLALGTCPSCGAGYPAGGSYCNTCGSAVRRQREA